MKILVFVAGIPLCLYAIWVCLVAIHSILCDCASVERVRRGRLWCFGGVHTWKRLSPNQRQTGSIRKCHNCERLEDNYGPNSSVYQKWMRVDQLPDARINKQ